MAFLLTTGIFNIVSPFFARNNTGKTISLSKQHSSDRWTILWRSSKYTGPFKVNWNIFFYRSQSKTVIFQQGQTILLPWWHVLQDDVMNLLQYLKKMMKSTTAVTGTWILSEKNAIHHWFKWRLPIFLQRTDQQRLKAQDQRSGLKSKNIKLTCRVCPMHSCNCKFCCSSYKEKNLF